MLDLQASVGSSPKSRSHSWGTEALGLGQGCSHTGWSRGYRMSPLGLPGSPLSCNQLRCLNQKPRDTGTSGGVGWGAAQEVVLVDTRAGSWDPEQCTQSWQLRPPLVWASRPRQMSTRKLLSLHPQPPCPHCHQALGGPHCRGSGAVTTCQAPDRSPEHAHCPLAPAEAPPHLLLVPLPG